MKLLICMITYNRLDFTKRTLKSLLSTIKQPYFLVVVDNNSSDGTQKWLKTQKNIDLLILNDKNYYPGKACNIGWEQGLKAFPDADYLMRTDNDMDYIDGWYDKWEKYFDRVGNLGQLGLDYFFAQNAPHDMLMDWQPLSLQDENYRVFTRVKTRGLELIPWPGSVGGTCIIRRSIWDMGIRYDETPWHIHEKDVWTAQEDTRLSTAILRHGFTFANAGEELCNHFGGPDPESIAKYPEYYDETMSARAHNWQSKDYFNKKGNNAV